MNVNMPGIPFPYSGPLLQATAGYCRLLQATQIPKFGFPENQPAKKFSPRGISKTPNSVFSFLQQAAACRQLATHPPENIEKNQ
jgi:hypothetical protein